MTLCHYAIDCTLGDLATNYANMLTPVAGEVACGSSLSIAALFIGICDQVMSDSSDTKIISPTERFQSQLADTASRRSQRIFEEEAHWNVTIMDYCRYTKLEMRTVSCERSRAEHGATSRYGYFVVTTSD